MHIIVRGDQSSKFVSGTRREVVPFVGVNDSGRDLNGGIGLLIPGTPEITLLFQSTVSGTFFTRETFGAMMILEQVKWVTHETLGDCLAAAKKMGFVSDDIMERLSDSFYPGVHYGGLLSEVVNIPHDEVAPHKDKIHELVLAYNEG